MDLQSRLFAGHLGHARNFYGLSGYPPGAALEGKQLTDQHTAMVVEYLFLVACRHFYSGNGFLGLGQNRTDILGNSPVGGILRFSVGTANDRDVAID